MRHFFSSRNTTYTYIRASMRVYNRHVITYLTYTFYVTFQIAPRIYGKKISVMQHTQYCINLSPVGTSPGFWKASRFHFSDVRHAAIVLSVTSKVWLHGGDFHLCLSRGKLFLDEVARHFFPRRHLISQRYAVRYRVIVVPISCRP